MFASHDRHRTLLDEKILGLQEKVDVMENNFHYQAGFRLFRVRRFNIYRRSQQMFTVK